MAHLFRLRQQIHRIDAAAGVHHAEQQAHRLQAVRQHQRDGVAWSDAVLAQQRTDRAAGARQVGEREAGLAVGGDRVDRVRVLRRLAFDQRADGGRWAGIRARHAAPYFSK